MPGLLRTHRRFLNPAALYVGASAGGGAATATFVVAPAIQTATWSWTNNATGTAATNKRTVVCLGARSTNSATTATVTYNDTAYGGAINTTMSAIIQENNTAGGAQYAALFEIADATGINADISISWSAAPTRAGIAIYSVISSAGATASNGNSSAAAATTIATNGNLTVPASGCVIGTAFDWSAGTNNSTTTTNLGTPDTDVANGNQFTSAHNNSAATGSFGFTFTASDYLAGAWAAWGP